MATKKQVKANKQNALESTGPIDTENTKFNATKHGLTGNRSQDNSVNDIFDELASTPQYKPKNVIQRFFLRQIALYIWRLGKSQLIEQNELKNSLKTAKNRSPRMEKTMLETMGIEQLDAGEEITEGIDLIMRYEVTNENRLIKLLKIYPSLK